MRARRARADEMVFGMGVCRETANYLALVFAEAVTEPDILRLGLDGQLKPSV